MKKMTDILKEAGISGKVFTGQAFKSEINEKKEDVITVPGVGRYDYKGLKRNVEKKIKDLARRNKQGAHYGVGENQFKLLSAMWMALQEYEENQ